MNIKEVFIFGLKKNSLKTVKSNQTYNLFWTFLAPLDTYFKLFFNIFCFLE